MNDKTQQLSGKHLTYDDDDDDDDDDDHVASFTWQRFFQSNGIRTE